VASSDSDPVLPPRIGLTTYIEDARWGVWDRPAALLPHSYVAAVLAAGGLPVLLPPASSEDGGRSARSALAAVDALILTGGGDVSPASYGAAPHPATGGVSPDRDAWEIALLTAALARDLPVLAICRGAQVMNVARGGTLHQHVPDEVGHEGHRPEPGVLGMTSVRLAPGTPLAAILDESIKVPCYHHQAVDRLGDGLVAAGWADDGLVEALFIEDHRFALAVQWHPEDGDDLRLFEALVGAAKPA